MKFRHFSRSLLCVGALLVSSCGSEGTAERDSGGPVAASTVEWQPAGTPENTPVALHGQLRVEGANLVNSAGQNVQLKGVSSMWLNYEGSGYAESLDALLWMRDNWNLSVIRAAMGVEPNGAYLSNRGRALAQVRKVVQNAIDAGVYVIIDWHDHNAELHEAEAIEFFQLMAEEFGEYPNVFYETYNEPENDGGVKPWGEMLKPYHEAVVAGIRQIDPDNIAILGTGQWSQRVDLAAADPLVGNNLMYTVHFYSCTHRERERGMAEAALRLDLPIFVTEWGATDASGGTDPDSGVCADSAQEWHDFMNERNISWAAWKLDDCADVSCFFKPAAPRDGEWTAENLNGHGQFVIDRMLD